MQINKILLIAGALTGLPAIGHAQQAPGEVSRDDTSEAEIRRTVRAQTQAILKLHEQIAALEARVTELEKAKADKHPNAQ